jgi:hypothetical protein
LNAAAGAAAVSVTGQLAPFGHPLPWGGGPCSAALNPLCKQ